MEAPATTGLRRLGEDVVVRRPATTSSARAGPRFTNATTDGELLATGGGGDDTIYAQDGEQDVVNCGAGWDTAYVDRTEAASTTAKT